MIATDGSDCSILAAGKRIELAQMSGETVYAVYVVLTAYYLRWVIHFSCAMAIEKNYRRHNTFWIGS
jgi:nucleotide-binding universal stress UspA family protein